MMLARIQKPVNRAVGIIEITEIHTVCRTYGYARRVKPILRSMDAEGAFICVAVGMNEAGIIRARSNAGLATDAFFLRNQNHFAKFMNVACTGGTTRNARGIVAMITAFAPNLRGERRKCPFRVLYNPIFVVTFGDIVFSFACNNTIHTSYALHCIDNHSESCHDYATSLSIVTKFMFMPVPPISGSTS